jgi:Spy/CpxP family protein refolding chaperone
MRRIVFASIVAAALVACSSDTTAPSSTDLIADFEAASSSTQFTVAGGYDEDLYQLRLGNGLPDALELTPEQEEKITALVKAFKEANKADQEALKAIIREAKKARKDGKSDAEIKTILDKGTPIAAKLAAAAAKLKADIDAILTAEQRAWLASHEPKNCRKNQFPPLTDEQKAKIRGFEAAFKESSKADQRAVKAGLKEIEKAAHNGVSTADIQKILDGIKPAIDRLADGRKKLKEQIESVLTAEQKASGCLPLG